MSETKSVVYVVVGYDTLNWDLSVQKLFRNKIDALKFIRSMGYKKLREGMYFDSYAEIDYGSYNGITDKLFDIIY